MQTFTTVARRTSIQKQFAYMYNFSRKKYGFHMAVGRPEDADNFREKEKW